MLIELQPLGSFPTPASVGIFIATLLFSVALFISLRREGKAVQAVVVPSVLLVVFLGVLLDELRRVYSLERKDGLLVIHTLLGSTATACVDVERRDDVLFQPVFLGRKPAGFEPIEEQS